MSRGRARLRVLLWSLAALSTAVAHHSISICGTTIETPRESLFLHRQAQRARASRIRPLDVAPPSNSRDIGNIAILEDANGAVERQNQFNLDHNSVIFTPGANAASYRYSVEASGYDSDAAANGSPLAALDDDDARAVNLPFAFPFFGVTYTQVFVNSDGNLTFGAAEYASTERSLGRMTAGPPRIAPLFDDLDPSKTSGGVRVFYGQDRLVASWVIVPEYTEVGVAIAVTFQVELYSDGRIRFAYNGVSSAIASAVVGIAPGNLQGGTTLVDFRGDPSGIYSGTVAERFGNSLAIDIVNVAQQFYQTHDDSYDYLVIYNNMNIQALGDAVAYENTVRSNGSGYNVPVQDSGAEYGSASRLHAVLNMGQLTQYPVDPNALVPARATAGDTPLTVLGHEAGHLFLAYASIRDPANPTSLPMLGYQLAHWNFAYDSEASLLEGERIVDRGATVKPRFLTTDTVQGYSPLDQYLMGFRPPSQVADTFVVTGALLNGAPFDTSQLHPLSGVAFDGTRLDVTMGNLIQQQGRRTPDDTVAQRRFRFAFILIVPQGSQPSAADLSQVDAYRRQFETFYANASSGNGVADTSLKHSLQLSLSPNAGVVAGGGLATGIIHVQTPPAADLQVQLQTAGAYVSLPSSVTVPAGAASASFLYSGRQAGVEELLAIPFDPSYETAAARLQVADASMLKLVAVSGDQQVSTTFAPLSEPIVVRLTDVNNLPYPGARIAATPSIGGIALPAQATTDAQGQAGFTWTPGLAPTNYLKLTVQGAPAVSLIVSAGHAVPVITTVANAASFAAGISPGAFATIQGQNLAGGRTAAPVYATTTLAGVQVTINGSPIPLLYVSDRQINFYVPADLATGAATLVVVTPSGVTASAAVNISALQPGIFPGAILNAATSLSAAATAVHAGDTIEIYCTGLGATQGSGISRPTIVTPTVFVGPVPVQPAYSGLAPGFVGLYRVDVQVPAGLAPGLEPVILEIDRQHSNVVDILVQ